jgi:hypothetical protein
VLSHNTSAVAQVPLIQRAAEQFAAVDPVWYYIAAVAAAYLILIFAGPIRLSLRDGWRCVRRYPRISMILAVFGVCYAAFQLALQMHYHFVLQGNDTPPHTFTTAWMLRREQLMEAMGKSILPAAESAAGIFNNLVTTYPFSALAALLLLINWQGHHVVLNRTLRKHYGGTGWLIYIGIITCTLAALIKPALYVLLPRLNVRFSGATLLQWSSLIDAASFIFEYLFGVCVQLYLILLVYMWVRGMTFTHSHLLDVAIRRFSYVARWAAIVMLLSTLFIHLPLIAASTPGTSNVFAGQNLFDYIDGVARPVLALFLIMSLTVQITLTFHSESLRNALLDHVEFVRRHWWPLSWFVILAAIQFWLMHLVFFGVTAGFDDRSLAVVGWKLIFPMIAAVIDAWLLASWVCLFRRCETGQEKTNDWIKF